MTKRNRPIMYSFRISEEEKKIIDGKVKTSGLSRTEFIIRAIKKQSVIVVDNAGEILTELRREGNNLNQLTRMNYLGQTFERELNSCLNKLKELHSKLMKAIGGG